MLGAREAAAPNTGDDLLAAGWQSCASAFGSLVSALTDAGLRAVAYDAPAHGALWLHDDGDQQIPQTQSELLLRAHSHSGELVTTTGLGHNRILGDAEVIAHLVDHLTSQLETAHRLRVRRHDSASDGFRSR